MVLTIDDQLGAGRSATITGQAQRIVPWSERPDIDALRRHPIEDPKGDPSAWIQYFKGGIAANLDRSAHIDDGCRRVRRNTDRRAPALIPDRDPRRGVEEQMHLPGIIIAAIGCAHGDQAILRGDRPAEQIAERRIRGVEDGSLLQYEVDGIDAENKNASDGRSGNDLWRADGQIAGVQRHRMTEIRSWIERDRRFGKSDEP